MLPAVVDRVIIVERKRPGQWDYGLDSGDGKMIKVGWAVAAEAGHDISHDDQGLWPTVLLLLRQHSDEERIEYPLDAIRWSKATPVANPSHSPTEWRRGTAGAAKGGGATLGDRAQRQREPGSDPL